MAIDIRSWLQGTVGVFITIIVLLVCVTYFAVRLATRSHPTPYNVTESAVLDSAHVYRNTFGIPHIVGNNIHDVLFAQGYVHAQDRLWQMDVWRRIGRGRLAEVLGKRVAGVDVFMRALDIAGVTRAQVAQLDSNSRRMLDAYAEGVSSFIAEHKQELPFEFDALQYEPDPWTAEDCMIVGRVVSFGLSLAFWNDISFAQIAQQRGADAMLEYIPQVDRSPYVLDSNVRSIFSTPVVIPDSLQSQLKPLFKGLQEDLAYVRSELSLSGSSLGSNCWAVSRGAQGAILANDPHLSVSMPSIWYPNHLTSPELNAVGMSIPGIPLVISGRNDSLAWGVTNAMVDDVDYMIEHIDSTNSNYYFEPNGDRVKFKYRRDTIHIKDDPDSLVDLRFTKRSCIISDVHFMRDPSLIARMPRRAATDYLQRRALSFRWTALLPSNEILALYRINTASSFKQVVDAVSTWNSPAFNFHVATRSGDVGTVVSGVIPKRGKTHPLMPIDVADPDADWQGTIHLSTLGTVYRKGRGSVSSANNATMRQGSFISSFFEPSSRIERINEQLGVYKEMTARDAQVMQLDIVSPYAKRLTKRTLSLLRKGSARFGVTEKEAMALLSKWDGAQSSIDPAAAIHAVFLQRLIWNTFEDELGTQLFYDWAFVGSNALRRIDELIDEPQHPFFDDVRTKPKEDLGWIAIRSFLEAIRELKDQFDSDRCTDWQYGKLHTVTFPHMFGEHPLMKPVMNAGPFEVGGSTTTIFNTEWSVCKPYATKVTASMRLVSDLEDSVQYCVLPGGVSGQPLDAHYTDQLQLWLKGGYVRLPTGRKPDVSFRLFNVFLPSS